MTTTMEFCTPPIPGETHRFYGDAHNHLIHLPHYKTTTNSSGTIKKRPKEQKTLHNLAAIGNLILLKQILLLLPDPIKAAHDPHPSTGLTPLHYAATRGHLKVVECLVEDYAAVVDAKDNEGETALHKAAYNGRYHIVKYLQSKNANIHQQDKDGWTALHNACARGYLPIVRLLVNHGARVDVRSKLGHTPLINAASKGHISIVEYLLDEAHANPLLKNNIGEAAYDASAASREAYICELLEKAEKKWWHTQGGLSSTTRNSQYDVLDYHVTVMVTLHENQRATSLLGLSRPQFDSAYLTKQDTRGPWSLHPSGLPSSKDKVEPPRQSNNSGKANWFWITDWQIDQSDPRVDPTSGWQYARSFENEMDEQWTPVAPTSGNGWVRRRRWVRVMNRQVDFARNLEHESETHGDYLSAAQDMVVGASYDGVETGQRLQAMKKLLRIYEESVQFLLAGIKDDTNQSRKERANNLVKVHSAKIDHINADIAILAPISPTPMELVDKINLDNVNPGVRSHRHSFQPHPDGEGDDNTNTQQDDESGSSSTFIWESNLNVKDCRRCNRRFGLLNRRHHCRRCGLIVCDRCSPSRAFLPASQVLQHPNGPIEPPHVLESQQQRICIKCHVDLDPA